MQSPVPFVLLLSLAQLHLSIGSKLLIESSNSNSPTLEVSDEDAIATGDAPPGQSSSSANSQTSGQVANSSSNFIPLGNSVVIPEGESRIIEQIDGPLAEDSGTSGGPGANGGESEDDIKAKESSKWNVSKPLPKQASEKKWSSDTGCHEEEAILKECKRRLSRGKIQKDASSPASGSSTSNNPASPASAIRIADAAASQTMFGRNASQECYQCGSPCTRYCCYAGQRCCLYTGNCSCCY